MWTLKCGWNGSAYAATLVIDGRMSMTFEDATKGSNSVILRFLINSGLAHLAIVVHLRRFEFQHASVRRMRSVV